ncbi:M17 family metallopeptidase [endosymbiont GvMRE of Glomus versiforme]|uniref:M17 family metallopeptidase n=1 Tax=endosymbiont GvMRE of Glomus versiforme TaxID=2039283 RepID=UPI000EDD3535|nr:M17 family metallopeptidase [endosymbiont GvMRE of Glomus versiforme]RHZ35399.1 Leucyl aminopeptidase [endosymbiont GvMRE of Glomus versiforme]
MIISIVQKKSKEFLTLRTVTEANEEELHSLIDKKNWKTTLISEEKTCYLYLNKEDGDYNFHSIYNFFVSFAGNSERNWNVDIQSFATKNLSEEAVIQAVSEGILFGSHQIIDYKQKKLHSCFENDCHEFTEKIQAKVMSCELVHKDKDEKPKGSYEIKIKDTENEKSKKSYNNKDGILYYGLESYGKRKEPEKGKTYDFCIHGKSKGGYRLTRDWRLITNYYLITKNKQAQAILDNSLIKIEAVNWTRDLQDEPPNKLHAKEFAEAIKGNFGKLKNIEVVILDKEQIEKKKMGLLLAVNAGSHHEPRVVILRYFGDKKNKKDILGLVGKGITFDSGGYDLKPSQYLQGMKFDMSGAAVVCASFLGLIQKNPNINVVAIACLTENAIGGHATLTETVVKSMNGKTVEVNNTDAEGRLVLADGITYVIREEKATKIITVATLTGAVVASLGENLTGILTNNRKFYRELRQAFAKSQERYWELPIIPENTKALKENTSIADISNISNSRYMGASNGAAFLQEFVGKLPFIHCDIAGTANKTKTKRGTGVMTKTLIDLFQILQK